MNQPEKRTVSEAMEKKTESEGIKERGDEKDEEKAAEFFVVTVIPIVRGIAKETLTYFTKLPVLPGSVVLAPMRGKNAAAIVVKKEKAVNLKSDMRSLSFSLRRIEKVLWERSPFSDAFMETIKSAALASCATEGAVFAALLSKPALQQIRDIYNQSFFSDEPRKIFRKSAEKFLFQTDENERFARYRTLVRERFARGQSVFMLLPSIDDIETASEELQKGVEEYTVALHGGLSQKILLERWKKATNKKHSALIISTAAFLSLPRGDFGLIIVERAGSELHKSPRRPFLDNRLVAEHFAKHLKADIVFGDSLLPVELIFRYWQGEFDELSPLKQRFAGRAEEEIVDMRQEENKEESLRGNKGNRAATPKKKWVSISPELAKLITKNLERGERMFIFSARRGVSSIFCNDCESQFLCGKCGAPFVLHNVSNQRVFLCHRCGERVSAKALCPSCGSWNLASVGIGAERAAEDIMAAFPKARVSILTYDNAPTRANAQKIIRQFYKNEGNILIGTERALHYLRKPVENGAVVSADSLLFVPDFKMNEKIMSILIKMRTLVERKLVIQTRNPEQKLFRYATRGSLGEFFRDEIESRKTFGYPPYSVIIKITRSGEKNAVEKDMKNLREILIREEIIVFPSPSSPRGDRQTMHCLLKIGRERWPDADLSRLLASLPAQYVIDVNPIDIL